MTQNDSMSPNTTQATNMADIILLMMNADAVSKLTPSIVYTITLLVLGIPGNLIVMYVYYFQWKRCNSKYFIFTMALFDVVNCFIGLPTEVVIMFNYLNFDHPVVCKISRFTTFVMNGGSAIVLLIVAIDRFIRICRPTSKTMSCVVAIRLCIFTFVFSLCSNAAALVLYGTTTYPVPVKGLVVKLKLCLIDDNFILTDYPLVFFSWILIGFFLIAVVVTVLYVMIGVQVWRHREFVQTSSTSSSSDNKNRSKSRNFSFMSSDSSGENPQASKMSMLRGRRMSKTMIRVGKSTLMLFIITVVYYLSYVPYLVIAIQRTVDPKSGEGLTRSQDIAYKFFLRSYLLSSAVNPIIYSFLNVEFRKKVATLFKGCGPSANRVI